MSADVEREPFGNVGNFPKVQGKCPACGRESLFLASGGYVTCSIIGCTNPSAADEALAAMQETDCPSTFAHCGGCRKSGATLDEGTMYRVYASMESAGLTREAAGQLVTAMLNDGIVFRDRAATECLCNVGAQECPSHPDRPFLRGDDKEGQLAFRKAWDARVDAARNRTEEQA